MTLLALKCQRTHAHEAPQCHSATVGELAWPLTVTPQSAPTANNDDDDDDHDDDEHLNDDSDYLNRFPPLRCVFACDPFSCVLSTLLDVCARVRARVCVCWRKGHDFVIVVVNGGVGWGRGVGGSICVWWKLDE